MPYTVTREQLKEEAMIEALSARHEAQKWLDYAKRLAARWELTDLDLVVKFWK